MAFESRNAVVRVSDRHDPEKFGTGFVIHIETETAGPTVYFLTCAHVVEALGKNALTVQDNTANVVAIGHQDGLDLAVIKVALPSIGLHQPLLTTDGALQDRIGVHGFLGERRVSLKAKFNKYEDECSQNGSELRLYQFVLDSTEIEPDDLEEGYSGSPVVLLDKEEKIFAVTNTRRMENHRVGSCIPVWHVVKIWPEMPDQLGEQLFGTDYWPLLKKVRTQTETLTSNNYQVAFRSSCENPDEFPAEHSLWGCAVSLLRFERASEPTARLRRFLNVLGILEDTEESPANAPPGRISDKLKPPTQKAVSPSSVYRQLIIRIVKGTTSRRSDVGGRGGDRYWIEAHTFEQKACFNFCCDQGDKNCVPNLVRKIETTYARRTGDERPSGLRELLQEEIEEIIKVFGRYMPDLIQIIVPDEMLFDRVVTDQMDRVLVRQGQQPLADWQPTIFSGEQMSDPEGEGRNLLSRLDNSNSP